MREEMECFFKKMPERFGMFVVHFFPAIITELPRKMIAAIFANLFLHASMIKNSWKVFLL